MALMRGDAFFMTVPDYCGCMISLDVAHFWQLGFVALLCTVSHLGSLWNMDDILHDLCMIFPLRLQATATR